MASPEKLSKLGKGKSLLQQQIAKQTEAEAQLPPVEQTTEQSPVSTEQIPAAPPSVQPLVPISACEAAAEDSCSCRCRGKYHATTHPPGWKDEEGCEALSPAERKVAKKQALYAWRKAHPERVSTYMKAWRNEKKAKEKEAEIVDAAEEFAASEESVEQGEEGEE